MPNKVRLRLAMAICTQCGVIRVLTLDDFTVI